jgi:hypothetical protein
MGIERLTKDRVSLSKLVVPVTADKMNEVIDTLNSLTAVSCLKTIRKTIGFPGATTTDYKFTSAENTTEQVVILRNIIPARARIADIYLLTDREFVGATNLSVDVGSASGGDQYIAAADIVAKNAILPMAAAGAFVTSPSASVLHVYVNATPGANWNLHTEGQLSVYIIYIDVTDL